MKKLDKITPIEEDFGKWFTDVVVKGKLIDYGPIKGTMFLKPNSFGIWENIQNKLNEIFKNEEIQNVSFPLLIPESLIMKEKEHIEGFAPELLKVSKIGEKELEDPLCIRPTSEMLFGYNFQKNIVSYKDLPIKYNQWCNVIRWEKTTNPFLRNSEFLWQEGHTSHDNEKEAQKLVKKMIEIYASFLEKYLAIPTIMGKKTLRETFAGAVSTYTIEAMMKDGKALQSGTSHYLGQKFAKVMDITFKNVNNLKEFVYQTSWGVSTRLIGAIIMVHGDNRGIIIPPKIAPIQIDIIDFFGSKYPEVKEKTTTIFQSLRKSFRIRKDDSDKSPGFKVSESEIQGTPLRIEVGPRDLKESKVTVVRRDTLVKETILIKDLENKVQELLVDIQQNLLEKAKQRLNQNILTCFSYEELKKNIKNNKFVLVPFAGQQKEEQQIQNETTATARCLPFEKTLDKEHPCIITKKPTKNLVLFAKAY